jgi:hypothetical protein
MTLILNSNVDQMWTKASNKVPLMMESTLPEMHGPKQSK